MRHSASASLASLHAICIDFLGVMRHRGKPSKFSFSNEETAEILYSCCICCNCACMLHREIWHKRHSGSDGSLRIWKSSELFWHLNDAVRFASAESDFIGQCTSHTPPHTEQALYNVTTSCFSEQGALSMREHIVSFNKHLFISGMRLSSLLHDWLVLANWLFSGRYNI